MLSNTLLSSVYICLMPLLAMSVVYLNIHGLRLPNDDGTRVGVAGNWGMIIMGKQEMFGVLVLLAMVIGVVIGGGFPLVWVSTDEPTIIDRTAQAVGALCGIVIAAHALVRVVRFGMLVALLLFIVGIGTIPYQYVMDGDVNDRTFKKVLAVAMWPFNKIVAELATVYHERSSRPKEMSTNSTFSKGIEEVYGEWNAKDSKGGKWTFYLRANHVAHSGPSPYESFAANPANFPCKFGFFSKLECYTVTFKIVDRNTLQLKSPSTGETLEYHRKKGLGL